VELQVLRNLLYQALQSGKYEARMIASSLVETLPDLAISAIDLLGRYPLEAFNESLEKGIKSAGQSALVPLAKVLRTGSPSARLSALEVLAGIGTPSAVMEISAVLDILDPELAARVPHLLASVRVPLSVKVCLKLLTHKAVDVRCSALWALGELGDDSVLPVIRKVAAHRGIFAADNSERIAAVDALRRIGGQEALECLVSIANRRPLIGRDRYESVRQAAQTAVDEIKAGESIPMQVAV
jgi:HEAT repeat protein